jgi:hypothetical protein
MEDPTTTGGKMVAGVRGAEGREGRYLLRSKLRLLDA